MGDLTTPSESNFETMSQSEKAEWLRSQTIAELAKWAVRLNPEDRAACLSWLRSQNGQTEIETAFSSAAKDTADPKTHDTD